MEHELKSIPEWQKGYLAGIVDGEGSISLILDKSRPNHWKPMLRICSTSKDALYTICGVLGVGNIFKTERVSQGHKDLYDWTSYAVMDVWMVLDAIGMYLLIKRKHSDLLKEYCEHKIAGILNRGTCVRIYNELKDLNSRPEKEKIKE